MGDFCLLGIFLLLVFIFRGAIIEALVWIARIFPSLLLVFWPIFAILGTFLVIMAFAYFGVPYLYKVGESNDTVMFFVQLLGLISIIGLVVMMIRKK